MYCYMDMDMDIKHGFINKSNIKYVVTNTKCGDEVVALIRVNVGSRDEADELKGMSHLLEHMFFRGTEKYPTQSDLTSVLYRCGGGFNAYTSLDTTVFHITVSKKCIEEGLDILADSFYNSLFREEDLEKEKKIVINEINDYLSDPSTLMYYGLSELMYKGTRLEKDIAGLSRTIRSIDIDMMKNFINTYYQKDVVVSISGNVDCQKMVLLIKKFFKKKIHYDVKKVNKLITNDKKRELYPQLLMKQKIFQTKFVKKSEEQSFLGIGFTSYDHNDPKKHSLMIITEMLTGYLGSELYKVLRGEKGLVYGVQAGMDTFIDTGDFSITCSTENDSDKVNQCIVIILNELNKIKMGKINDKLFADTKKNLIITIKDMKYSPESLAIKYADDLIYSKKVISLDELQQNIKSVTIESVINVANELFTPEKLCICYTGSNILHLR